MGIYGIISDIHGNKEAFLAVLNDIAEKKVDRIVCLGDIIGYCADSNECIRLVQENHIEAIVGNHEEIALRGSGFDNCSDAARFSLKKTIRDLTEHSFIFLRSLPKWRLYEDLFVVIHGGFGNSGEYMVGREKILENYRKLKNHIENDLRVCFFGHTHLRSVYSVNNNIVRDMGKTDTLSMDHHTIYFINPGSVDASRKEDSCSAEYATYDANRKVIAFHDVFYDHESTERNAVLNGYRIDALHRFLYKMRRKLF